MKIKLIVVIFILNSFLHASDPSVIQGAAIVCGLPVVFKYHHDRQTSDKVESIIRNKQENFGSLGRAKNAVVQGTLITFFDKEGYQVSSFVLN
jgi:hypothetical protein